MDPSERYKQIQFDRLFLQVDVTAGPTSIKEHITKPNPTNGKIGRRNGTLSHV